jgi:hypothetical protein
MPQSAEHHARDGREELHQRRDGAARRRGAISVRKSAIAMESGVASSRAMAT